MSITDLVNLKTLNDHASDHWPLLLRLTDVDLDHLPVVTDAELAREEQVDLRALVKAVLHLQEAPLVRSLPSPSSIPPSPSP